MFEAVSELSMNFDRGRKTEYIVLDKVLVPVTFRLYPIQVFLQGIRSLFNKIYNKYLNYNKGKYPPEVLYLSDNYLVINKPWDVKVNSDKQSEFTVATTLKEHFPHLVDDKCTHHFRFAHRLDYPTSGVLCLALNQKAASRVQKKFLQRKIVKHYLALVGGYLSESYILVDVPIGKDHLIDYKHKMCPSTSIGCVDSKQAVTLVILLEQGLYGGAPASKVLLIPYTGRTHQLRVHCNLIGHTIIGDYTYSNEKDTEPYRMMLHAYRFTAPLQTEPMDILSPDPFVTEKDAKWTHVKVFKSYDNITKENLALEKTNTMDILKYHTMEVHNNKRDDT